MITEVITGNDQTVSFLASRLEGGRPGHALIISGPCGAGKKTIAGVFAAALVCPGGGSSSFTREWHENCPSCQKARAGSHPDITVIENGGKDIPVAMIRAARHDAFIRPNEAVRKVYIIPDADRLSPACQNALLSILEEPPVHAVFILLAENIGGLLLTVRSRCAHVIMGSVSESECTECLRRMFPDKTMSELTEAAVRTGGIIGAAAGLLRGGDPFGDFTGRYADALAKRDEAGLFSVCMTADKMPRDELPACIDGLYAVMTEALVCKRAVRAYVSTPARVLSSAFTAPVLSALCEFIARVRGMCDFNVSSGHIAGMLSAGCMEII